MYSQLAGQKLAGEGYTGCQRAIKGGSIRTGNGQRIYRSEEKSLPWCQANGNAQLNIQNEQTGCEFIEQDGEITIVNRVIDESGSNPIPVSLQHYRLKEYSSCKTIRKHNYRVIWPRKLKWRKGPAVYKKELETDEV